MVGEIPVTPYIPDNLVHWQTPNAGLLVTLLELTNWISPPLTATYNLFGGNIAFEYFSGDFPRSLAVVKDPITSVWTIQGHIDEMDSWVPDYQQPEGFTYDTPTVAGGNYATYGSALYGTRTFSFVIRAYEQTAYIKDTHTLLYPVGSYEDRTFSITILNNYSSDRDAFMHKYFEGQTLIFNGDSELSPDDYILAQKAQGYYD